MNPLPPSDSNSSGGRQPMSRPSRVGNELDATVERLNGLLVRLHEANARCAAAAEPLARLSEMDQDQKAALGRLIRAANQEWDEVTRLIDEALHADDEPQHEKQT